MDIKQSAMLLVKVGVAFAAICAFQKHVYKVPVIGAYLPGGQ